jgi:hypothetical protein
LKVDEEEEMFVTEGFWLYIGTVRHLICGNCNGQKTCP